MVLNSNDGNRISIFKDIAQIFFQNQKRSTNPSVFKTILLVILFCELVLIFLQGNEKYKGVLYYCGSDAN